MQNTEWGENMVKNPHFNPQMLIRWFTGGGGSPGPASGIFVFTLVCRSAHRGMYNVPPCLEKNPYTNHLHLRHP